MKKLILILFLSFIILIPDSILALSLDSNNITMETNDSKTINLYANTEELVKEIDFTLVYSSYDVPAYLNLEPGLTDSTPNSVNHKIKLPKATSGKIKIGSIKINTVVNPKVKTASINLNSARAITEENTTINLKSQTINITVSNKKEDTKKDETIEVKQTSLLEKIDSDIVTIKLTENIYEYTVNISADVKELDLKPVAISDKTKIEISSQKISELKDNQIIITLTNNNLKEEYKINVKVIEEIEVDDEVFVSTYKYKGKWVTLIIIMSIILIAGIFLNKKK